MNIYTDLENRTVFTEEMKNKRGRINYAVNCVIVTYTVRSTKNKLVEKDVVVSIGSFLNLKPFFITYASDNEMSLCLC